MPLGPGSTSVDARTLSQVFADATRGMLRTGQTLLIPGSDRPTRNEALTAVDDAISDARSELRQQLRRTLPRTAAAWLAGALACIQDVDGAGLNPDGRLDEVLAELSEFIRGAAVEFDAAVAELPDAEGDIRSGAAQLAHDLDDAFTAAAAQYRHVMQEMLTVAEADPSSFAAASQWTRFLDRGLTVPAASGRRVNVDSYTRALAETRLTAAAVAGYFNRAVAAGVAFVAVSTSVNECVMCGPWEGRLLARSRAALQRASESVDVQVRAVTHTFDTAIAAGLFHPGCRHTVSAWVEGVSRLPAHDAGADTSAGAARLSELERTVAKWDRRAAFALTGTEQARARAKAAEWRQQLTDARPRPAEPAPPAPRAVQAGPVREMLARPLGVLLSETGDPNSSTDTGLLRANAQGAASEFCDDPARNPDRHRLRLEDLQASVGDTGLRYRIENASGHDIGGFLVSVVGPPRHPVVQATAVDATSNTVREFANAFTTAWQGPAPAPLLPRRDPTPVTSPYLHPWPVDMSGMEVTGWVNNSSGVSRSFEVTFADGSKGLYKPIPTRNGLFGRSPDPADSASLREVVGCMFDRAMGANLTPATTWWDGPEGPGSLQRWAAPAFPTLAPFKHPEADRQRLVGLDFVIGNWDRHPKNVLATHDRRLISIDLGLSGRHRNGMLPVTLRYASRWWPLGRIVGEAVWEDWRATDTERLYRDVAATGFPDEEFEANLARLAHLHRFGTLPTLDQV